MIIVVDASVAVKWYIGEQLNDMAEKLLEGRFELFAPELIVPEFGSIIWKKVRRGEITSVEGRKIVTEFTKHEINLQSHTDLLAAAYIGAELSGQTVYDWTYLALAVILSCAFVTADARFYNTLAGTPMRKHLLWLGDL